MHGDIFFEVKHSGNIQIIQNNCVLDNKRILEKGTILFTSLEQDARAIISKNLVHFHCFAAADIKKENRKHAHLKTFCLFSFSDALFYIKVFSIFATGMSRQYHQNQLEIIAQASWT